MSILFNQLHILFFLFLLQTFNLTLTAPAYYGDYNSFDLDDKDAKDYWENDEPNPNEVLSNGVRYVQECKPKTYSTTTTSPSTTTNSYTTSETTIPKEAEDVVEHIVKIMRSMREHAIALVRNMNELEMDILSSSSNLDAVCKNSTNSIGGTANNIGNFVYPDILSQVPGYVINEWSVPMKKDPLTKSAHASEYVAEAQEAFKSWKQQIETCKNILDNAIHDALRKSNLKTDIMLNATERETLKRIKNKIDYPSSSPHNKLNNPNISFKQLPSDLKGEERKMKRSRSNKKHKYHSFYDNFHAKEEDY